jgi:hypothetical protein
VVHKEENILLHQSIEGTGHTIGTSYSLHQTAVSVALLLSNPLIQTLTLDKSTLGLVVTPLFVSPCVPSKTESQIQCFLDNKFFRGSVKNNFLKGKTSHMGSVK